MLEMLVKSSRSAGMVGLRMATMDVGGDSESESESESTSMSPLASEESGLDEDSPFDVMVLEAPGP